MNRNTRRLKKETRKTDKHFHGELCDTAFNGGKHRSRSRKSAWKGCHIKENER